MSENTSLLELLNQPLLAYEVAVNMDLPIFSINPSSPRVRELPFEMVHSYNVGLAVGALMRHLYEHNASFDERIGLARIDLKDLSIIITSRERLLAGRGGIKTLHLDTDVFTVVGNRHGLQLREEIW